MFFDYENYKDWVSTTTSSNLMTTWPSDFTAFTNPAVDLLSFSIKFNPDTATNLASNHDPTKILITKNVIKIFYNESLILKHESICFLLIIQN